MTDALLTIAVEKIGPVARLTLGRPERANALNAAMLRGFDDFAADRRRPLYGIDAVLLFGFPFTS
jgi:enoyl-CoA hydratase/carnithine racemase